MMGHHECGLCCAYPCRCRDSKPARRADGADRSTSFTDAATAEPGRGMKTDQFLKHWGFVAVRTDPVDANYVRATYAEPGQTLNNGHHYRAESVEEALRGLHVYLQTRGLKPREAAT